MMSPQSGPEKLRGSQWSVFPEASDTPGLYIYGVYMCNNYFYILLTDIFLLGSGSEGRAS